MSKRKPREETQDDPAGRPTTVGSEAEQVDGEAAAGTGEIDVAGPDAVAPAPADSGAVEQALEELKDRHLRLAAEYDNYRKRIARERTELRQRLQAELAGMMLDAVDDLTRVTEVDPETAAAGDIIAGVELVERKLMRELESVGVKRVGGTGEPFDPNLHEAVGAEPAGTPEMEGTIADVLQPGYQLGELLIRPARVRVYVSAAGH